MKVFFFFFLFLVMFITACGANTGQVIIDRPKDNLQAGSSFQETDNEICTQEGKPIIREFATSWCPHCAWVKPVYNEAVKEYGGQIVAYQWEIDTSNDLLTEELEFEVPASEMNIFRKFNPQESIPTFVFGCRYVRIGNAFEEQDDKEAEAAEFRSIIDKLLGEVNEQ